MLPGMKLKFIMQMYPTHLSFTVPPHYDGDGARFIRDLQPTHTIWTDEKGFCIHPFRMRRIFVGEHPDKWKGTQ